MTKKVSIVLIVILITFSVCFYAYYTLSYEPNDDAPESPSPNVPETPEEVDYDMLIVDNISNWAYLDGAWFTVDTDDMENHNFAVYVDNKYMGNYRMKYGTVWNLFDNNDSYVEYTGDLFAYSNNFNVNVANYTINGVGPNEITEITNILNHEINQNSLSINEVVQMDLDANGIMDKIVNISNLDSVEEEQYYFNLCYVVLNNQIKVLINDSVESRELLLYPVYKLRYIFKYADNNSYSFILQEGYFSNAGKTQNNLYDIVNGEYIKSFSD